MNWIEKEQKVDGISYLSSCKSFSAILSEEIHSGLKWLHLSISSKFKKIDFDFMRNAKDRFIGKDKYAFMIFPPKDKHVNIYPNCYHVFHCVDRHPFPEFSGFIDGIRSL